MKNVKNLQYFTAITFFILSILFTVTSSAVPINFNPDGSKNVISYLESGSPIVNWNILSITYAQEDGSGEVEEVEEQEEEVVEEEEEEEVVEEEEEEEVVEEEEEEEVVEEEEEEEVVEEEEEEEVVEEEEEEVTNQPQIGFSIPFEPENTNDEVETGLSKSSSTITDEGLKEGISTTPTTILQQPSGDSAVAISNGIGLQESVLDAPESDISIPPPCPPEGDPNNPNCPPPQQEECPTGQHFDTTTNACIPDLPPPCPPEGNPNNQNCPPPPCPPEGDPNNQNCATTTMST